MRVVINMRYAQIRECDISNGEGVGVALFVQGCHFHCKNCFNSETWDFNGGKEWTKEVENKFLELIEKPYIRRISVLGGEPLANENLDDVLDLVNKIRLSFPKKSIWLYTGYHVIGIYDNLWVLKPNINDSYFSNNTKIRSNIISLCDVLIDGRYIDSQRDITLKWKGSKNQRVIDVQQSLQKGEVILWDA